MKTKSMRIKLGLILILILAGAIGIGWYRFSHPDHQHPKGSAQMLKTISYRGGIVKFQIPVTWKEEYEEQGGGTFFEDRDGSGTLRLNLVSAIPPPDKFPIDGASYFSTDSIPTGAILKRRENGDGVLFFQNTAQESGNAIEVSTWNVAHSAPPKRFYMAIFTWTILASQSEEDECKKEISLLSKLISETEISPSLDPFYK